MCINYSESNKILKYYFKLSRKVRVCFHKQVRPWLQENRNIHNQKTYGSFWLIKINILLLNRINPFLMTLCLVYIRTSTQFCIDIPRWSLFWNYFWSQTMSGNIFHMFSIKLRSELLGSHSIVDMLLFANHAINAFNS